MAESRSSSRTRGFSMVEMMVALVFTMVLMAGLAAVFKASLSGFFTSGENISSLRRNRMSLDLLGQDLDTACMYLGDITDPPTFSDANQAFCILPNMPIVGDPFNDNATADQLFFYLDQPLPFEGSLQAGAAGTQRSDAQLVAAAATQVATDTAFTIDCGNSTYANQVVNTPGLEFIFKDTFEQGMVNSNAGSTPTVNGSSVTVNVAGSQTSGITGSGPTGLLKASHMAGSGIVFLLPAQMVRYSVQYLKLDPDATSDSHLIPCLVRDQGNYTSLAGFTPDPTKQQIITENVSRSNGFKVYLSVSPNQIATNNATAWAGLGITTSGLQAWTDSILGTTASTASSLTSQLAVASPNATLPSQDYNWFRSVPTLVRVDVTTQTVKSRTEYGTYDPSTGKATSAYQTLTQSLIFVPRHSGLPMNWD